VSFAAEIGPLTEAPLPISLMNVVLCFPRKYAQVLSGELRKSKFILLLSIVKLWRWRGQQYRLQQYKRLGEVSYPAPENAWRSRRTTAPRAECSRDETTTRTSSTPQLTAAINRKRSSVLSK